MKRIIFILFMAFTIPAVAQLQTTELYLMHYDYIKKWRFGFTLGGHIFDYAITNSEKPVFSDGTPLMAEVTQPGLGFNVNGLVDYRIVRNWHLRSGFGICFGQREIDFHKGKNGPVILASEYDSYYLEIPLSLKYSANRYSNFRPYFIVGAAARYNLTWKPNLAKNVVIGFKPFEPFYEGGFGFDWYFYYFKLSFEIKYSGGFLNLKTNNLVDDFRSSDGITANHFNDAISRLNSRMLLFSFHFE